MIVFHSGLACLWSRGLPVCPPRVPGTESEPGEEHMGLRGGVPESQAKGPAPQHQDLQGHAHACCTQLWVLSGDASGPHVSWPKVSILTSGKDGHIRHGLLPHERVLCNSWCLAFRKSSLCAALPLLPLLK